jgi:hypothetical protein
MAPITNADSSVIMVFPLGSKINRYWRVRFTEAP